MMSYSVKPRDTDALKTEQFKKSNSKNSRSNW